MFEDIDDIDYTKKQYAETPSKRSSRHQSQKTQKTISFSNPDNKSVVQSKSREKQDKREVSVSKEKQNVLNQSLNQDIQNQLDQRPCQIAVFGAVDSGKSTIFGNLYQQLYKQNTQNNKPYASIFDNTEYEQQSGKTTQVCNYQIEIENQQFVLQDCPGHSNLYELIAKNQIYYDACVLVIDSTNYERQLNQIQDLICIITVQKVKHVLVLINKMDKIQYQRTKYQQICDKIQKVFKKLNSGVINIKLQFIPVCGNTKDSNESNIIKISYQMGFAQMCLKDALLQVAKKSDHKLLKLYQQETSVIQIIDSDVIGNQSTCLINVISGIIQKEQPLYDQDTKQMYQIQQILTLNRTEVPYAVGHQLCQVLLTPYKKNIENNIGLRVSSEIQEFPKNRVLIAVKSALQGQKPYQQETDRIKVQLYTNDIIEVNDILSVYIANRYVEGRVLGIEAVYDSQQGFVFTDKYFLNKNQIGAVDIKLDIIGGSGSGNGSNNNNSSIGGSTSSSSKTLVAVGQQGSLYNKVIIIGQDKVSAYGFIKAAL